LLITTAFRRHDGLVRLRSTGTWYKELLSVSLFLVLAPILPLIPQHFTVVVALESEKEIYFCENEYRYDLFLVDVKKDIGDRQQVKPNHIYIPKCL
jgi:hypothetical protein